TSYVRKHGMVSDTQSAATKSKMLVMGIALALLALPLLQDKTLLVLLAWVAILAAYRGVLNKRLGGYTGDTLGAAVEIQEVVLLVALTL
ncbi:MAG TPA: adenosylcobinamide-GDP ribazoletransferase, partial [Thiopseudomonas sp.]|nr:adenosylcobinamide-GDP ribazoletransferase [Thiopseudomonas sp.]